MSGATAFPAFDWEQVDQHLLGLKLSALSVEMNAAIEAEEREVGEKVRKSGNSAGYASAFMDMQKQRADEWAQRIYDACCDVWVETQGGAKSGEFIRAVFSKHISGLISARKGVAIDALERRQARTHSVPNLTAAVRQFIGEMERLKSDWRDKLEIEAREWEHAQRNTKQQMSAAPSDFNPLENLRNSILKKKARIAHIERILSRALRTESAYGKPARVSERSLLRLEEEKQHEQFALAELQREYERLSLNPFAPDDPRSRSWKMIRASVTGDEYSARAELIRVLEEKGELQLSDWLTFVERQFDAIAKALVLTVTDTASADERVPALDEASNRIFDWCGEALLGRASKLFSMRVEDLGRETRIRLANRVAHWKAQAYQYALLGEIKGVERVTVPPLAASAPAPVRRSGSFTTRRRVNAISAEFDTYAGRLMHEAHQTLSRKGHHASSHRATPDLPFPMFLKIARKVGQMKRAGVPKFPLKDVLPKALWDAIASHNQRRGNGSGKISTFADAAQAPQFKRKIRYRFNRAEKLYRDNIVQKQS